MSRIRVLLADKNVDFLRGASDWLVNGAKVDLVGATRSGVETIDLAERLAPDVVLMGESVPDMKTSEVVRCVKSLRGAPRVVLLSFLDGGATRQIPAAIGADGILPKARFIEALLPVLRAVLDRPPILTGVEFTRSES